MIGSMIAMFMLGMGVMLCICAMLFVKYIDPVYPDDDDIEEMYREYEEEYHGKH